MKLLKESIIRVRVMQQQSLPASLFQREEIPSLEKRVVGRFSGTCPSGYETLLKGPNCLVRNRTAYRIYLLRSSSFTISESCERTYWLSMISFPFFLSGAPKDMSSRSFSRTV